MYRFILFLIFSLTLITPALADDIKTTQIINNLYDQKDYQGVLDHCNGSDVDDIGLCAYYSGVIYGDSLLGEYKEKEACENYKIAAENDILGGYQMYGVCLMNGFLGEKNSAEAAIWWQKGADNDFAPSMRKLAYLYNDGDGVSQDYAKASELFESCAEQNDAICDFDAWINLSEHGTGKRTYRQSLDKLKAAPLDLFNENGQATIKHMIEMDKRMQLHRQTHTHAPELFGVKLEGALRGEIRHAVKAKGVEVIREDYVWTADQYTAANLLEGANRLSVLYATMVDSTVAIPDASRGTTDVVSRVVYTFDNTRDKKRFEQLKAAVEAKYGKTRAPGINTATVYVDGTDVSVFYDSYKKETKLVYATSYYKTEQDETAAREREKEAAEQAKKASVYKGAASSGNL